MRSRLPAKALATIAPNHCTTSKAARILRPWGDVLLGGGYRVDLRRHTPVGRYRAPRLQRRRSEGLSNVCRGRARHLEQGAFDSDDAGHQRRHPIKWMVSSMLAAAVTIGATGVVVYGSLETRSAGTLDIMRELERAQRPQTPVTRSRNRDDGLAWLTPKQDRLHLVTSTLVSRIVHHEQIQVRRNDKPFLQIRPYLRISARLVPASRTYLDVIPPFDPIRLFAPQEQRAADDERDGGGFGTIEAIVRDLAPGEDWSLDAGGLEAGDVAEVVRRMILEDPGAPSVQFGLEQQVIDGLTPDYLIGAGADLIARSARRRDPTIDDGRDDTGREFRVITARAGDTIGAVLVSQGVAPDLAAAVEQTAQRSQRGGRLQTGQQVHVMLMPTLDGAAGIEPVKVSVFDTAHTHVVTVKRTGAGEFVAETRPDQDALIRAMRDDTSARARNTLYASIYATCLEQGLEPATILQILRLFAHETDYRRELRAGDQLDLFFEMNADGDGKLEISELVYAALTSGGDTVGFWRYRSDDGTIDFYNEQGQNNRQFLLRRPVRGSDVRLTSGFGMRRHPIQRTMRFHAGIDWAGPIGTPVLAAGNGVVEEARYRGANGYFISLRHANGYDTTYSHMLPRFGPGIAAGVRVRQGQVIGFVGSTGLSTGAHLHFEVHINGRPVDPLQIRVPRERALSGRDLNDFNRERSRLLAIMRSPPVRVAEKAP